MESLRSKFEEHLSCAICLEQFKDPKVLPCLHSYCLECIVRLDRTGSNITCPECRMTVEVGDPPDVSLLPSNFFAKNLLATLSLAGESDEGNITCENCDSGDPAKTRCEDCSRYLCQFCNDAHSRFRDTKHHTLKSLNELKESGTSIIAETIRCSKHKGEVIKLYCTTCQSTICRDCTIIDHRGHDFSFVEDVAQEKRDELKELLEVVKERKVEVSKGIENVVEREENVNARAETAIADINKYFEDRVKVLDIQKNEFIEEVNVLKDSKRKQLLAQREQLEITLASCDSNIEFTEQAFKNGNDVQILNMKKYISQSLESLKNKKSETQPCVDDHIEFIAESPEDACVDKTLPLCSVVGQKAFHDGYTSHFNESAKWLTVGVKSEIIISKRFNREIVTLKPVFTWVRVKDVSVSENCISFVPLEVGVLKVEVFINGRYVRQCGLSKWVKWGWKNRYEDDDDDSIGDRDLFSCREQIINPRGAPRHILSNRARGSVWGRDRRRNRAAFFDRAPCRRRDSIRVGDSVFESGIHTWTVALDHDGCSQDQSADFTIGVVHDDDRTVHGLEGHVKNACEISLKLDMLKGELTITPPWGKQVFSVYNVTSPKVSPYFRIDCDECDPKLIKMGPFAF